MTPDFFPGGEDLPLFSGAPVRVADRPFVPAPVVHQPALFDIQLDPFRTRSSEDPADATRNDPDAAGEPDSTR